MDGVIGEIRYFGFAYAPENFLPCDGRALNITAFQALYSLLFTRFGGDGRVTFMLPDLRGRAIICSSNLGGGGRYPTGTKFGEENVTLDRENIPRHTHRVQARTVIGTSPLGSGNLPSAVGPYKSFVPVPIYSQNAAATSPTSARTIGLTGGGSHSNMQPFAVVGYCICIQGVYPGRE